jgi:GNAT superfamily N-acetyltransferase
MGLYDIIKSMGSEMTGIAPSQRLMSQVTGETKPEAGFGLNMDTVNWIADLINNTVGVAGPAYGATKLASGLGKTVAEEATNQLIPRVIPTEGAGTKLEYLLDGKVVGTGQLLGKDISSIHVAEPYRRQGIGSKIMQDLIDRGGKSGYIGTKAGENLMRKAGMENIGGGQYGFK